MVCYIVDTGTGITAVLSPLIHLSVHVSCVVLILMEVVGLALGRFFCAISRTQVVAKSIVTVATLMFSTVSGFMPKYNQVQRL